YDFILIDAPCTSTGTMRRNPDINWRWSAEKIQEIVTTQYNLLRNSMDLVSRGGVVAYATCSLLAVENNLQFEKFLAEHIGLLEEVPPCAANGNPFSAKENRLSAGSRVPLNFTKYQGDAFFLALAKRL
ncbi:MAG: SAM-dependent methyltransferase, partial [Deltaproteobacteria bacterium]